MKELLSEAGLSEELAHRLLGDLAYRGEQLKEELAEEVGVFLATEKAERRSGVRRQQVEIAISTLSGSLV